MTQHISQEELILHYYGEQGNSDAQKHLAQCESCRAEFRSLQRVLNTVDSLPVPERSGAYGSEVWRRVESRLGATTRTRWWTGWGIRGLALAAGMAAVMVLAFIAGRHESAPGSAKSIAEGRQVRERVLLVAVGDHLERSQMVLAELANAGTPGKGRLDISYEQSTAHDLVESNRLYRMTAASAGDTATVSVLEELERVLLDVANGPSDVTSGQLEQLRRRIQDEGILFKVRVFASKMEQRENRPLTTTN
jgi:hypothetical protein